MGTEADSAHRKQASAKLNSTSSTSEAGPTSVNAAGLMAAQKRLMVALG
jgi:hypothetical protein